MGREEGGGFRMGNTCIPVADSFLYLAKPIQYCKVKKKKLKIQKTKIMVSGPITTWEIDVQTLKTVSDIFFWALISLQMVIAAMKLKDAYSLEGKL